MLSNIWKIGLYEKRADEKAACLDCQKNQMNKFLYSRKGGSTKPLLNHLLGIHKDSEYHKEFVRLQSEEQKKREKSALGQKTLEDCVNLIVQDAMKNDALSDLFEHCKSIVTHFRRSNKASEILTNIQIDLDLPIHKMINECPTRWNSAFLMLERIFEQREAIFTYAMNETRDFRLILTNEQYEQIDLIIKILKPIQEISVRLCKETLSSVCPYFSILHDKLIGFQISVEFGFIDEIRSALVAGIQKRVLDRFSESRLHLLSTVLDPRYKLKFVGGKERNVMIEKIKLWIESEIVKKNGEEVQLDGSETDFVTPRSPFGKAYLQLRSWANERGDR